MKSILEYLKGRDKQEYTTILATDDNIYQLVGDAIQEKGTNVDLNYIDVSQVTYMANLFKNTDFQGNVSDWDVSSVKDMRGMFYGCENFNSDLSKWNVSKVRDMMYMFHGCKNFNSDLSKWNVSKVRDMGSMFSGCSNFNADLSKWNVSKVTDMQGMFYECGIEEKHEPKF